MPKGGARMGSGPAPNPQSRRQTGSQAGSWTDLPAEGRKGKPPMWPLAPLAGDEDFTDVLAARELDVWSQIWATPQAVAWDRMGWTLDVALYVRMLVLGEGGSTKALSEARQWSDRLGLNPAAMLRNRWRVVTDQVEEKRAAKAAPKRQTRRLKVVDDAVARA